MAFQFQCPQGHLLEGDESQAGQAIHCPVCQMLFLIPAPVLIPEPPAPQYGAPQFNAPQFSAAAPSGEPSFVSAAPVAPPEPEILHIACPKGHVLEVPPDMLDTEVLCPQCGEQFELRARDSVEHKKKRAQQEALREERSNKFILNFAITVAVIVVLMLITLGIMTVVSTNKKEDPNKNKKPAPVVPAPETPKPAEPVDDAINPPPPPEMNTK